MKAKTRDLLGSVFMLIFVTSLWVQRDATATLGVIFPDIVMAGLVGLVAVTILLMFTRWRAIADEEDKKDASKFHWLEMAVVGIILLLWTVLLRHLGFITTSLFGFGGISWFLNERRNTRRGVIESLIVGAFMVALIVIVFQYLLKVPLPKGTLFR